MQLAFNLDPTPLPEQRSSPGIGRHERVLQHRDVRLTYTLQRSRRRSIGLTISEEGLKVTAPSWVSLQQIDQAVIEKFDWVLKKLYAQQARQQRLQQAASNWRSGGTMTYLGCSVQLQCNTPDNPTHRGKLWFDGDPQSPQSGDCLWMPLPPDSDTEQVRDLAHGWLQRQAKECFGQRLGIFEANTGLRPSHWRLSSATGRWGSCTADGKVSLNWRLIHFDLDVIDYVIAHELAHLRQMNHSPAFWDEVKSICPNYMSAYQVLKGLSPGDTPAL
jgi:predicted metal-dependent hydrolase